MSTKPLNINGKNLFQIKIIRYGVIGAVSTAVHVCVAFLYIYYIQNSLFMSNTTGFLVAYLFSYTVQSKYVFQHSVSFVKAFKYFVVQFASLLAAMVFSDNIELPNSYLQTIAVVVVLPLITFVVHKFWTFK